VVYRCTQLDACKITSSGFAGSGFEIAVAPTSFVVIDGFEIAAGSYSTYDVGIMVSRNAVSSSSIIAGAHHIWLLNNIIHGHGQAGVDGGMGEYYYYIHNESYDNSRVTCDAQGSGIGIATAMAVPGYTPSGMDLTFAPFHNIISFNVAHNNGLTQCGTATNKANTDGNGIIMDTFKDARVGGVTYPFQTLVSFNVTYNNGGGGVHVISSSNITVANNTTFNNQIDPFNNGTGRPQTDTNNGDNNVFINNVAYAVPATSIADPRCEGTNPCTVFNVVAIVAGNGGGGTDVNNSFSNNVTFTPGSSNGSENAFFDTDAANNTYTCTANKCSANPLFVAPSSTTTATASKNDPGNFALQAASPARGYAQPQSYLPSWVRDAGACDSSLTSCP
jgi:hypothetical protein